MAENASKWPAMTIEEAHAFLTAPGTPFEMETVDIRGVPIRTYKGTPPSLRAIFDLGRAHGEKEFIIYEGERLSYENHYRAATAFGRVLKEKYGVKKGDRVALIMRNFPEWSITFWAIAAIGGVIVPLNAWGTGPELEYGITDSGSKVVIVDHERLDRIRPHLKALGLDGLVAVRTPDAELGVAEAFETLVGKPGDYVNLPADALPDPGLLPEDDATIFYTSGTTGKPKGALGTQRNICTTLMNALLGGARSFLRRGEVPPAPDPDAPQRVTLLSVPLFHATGCHSILVGTYASGGKLVIIHKWNPEQALELIERERVTSFGGVPAMVWQVLESPDFATRDTSSVESIGYGGAPSAPDLVARIKKQFPKCQPSNGYGLTETSAITTQNLAEDYIAKPDSAGVAVPVCDIKVVDEKGNELPRGQVG